ncbi:hypothetical protein GRI62_12420 [Erythrobacter arachoides]|uniref:Uncharacterized protein n=1 Tax=Aurantiacibacter arachoides TaxID=1850444 RepID=A0A845A1I0_9SPHN|nr:hypothetical protein [Aurantiacibacter arachoides]MXO94401.1 hypothetical protein [Aurantiacibacter arachoides]GGD63769.1 hypothetical protein GCM10011411_25050 [Aurantiacibacter arachoides]
MSDTALEVLASTPLRGKRDPSPDVVVPLARIEANDNEAVAAPQQPEARMFELPANVWRAMITCYAVFLLALLGATGGAHAGFAIAIAAIYVAMFFGTARTMLRQSPPQPLSALERRGAVLQTAYGRWRATRSLSRCSSFLPPSHSSG